jgi:large subunit ribosomal protein L24
MKIRKDDSVYIQTGKDRGKTGTVTKVLKKSDRVVVDGINKTIKHVKKKEGQSGERVEFFAPIHISNVAILDPKTGKPTRIGYQVDGKTKVRIAKKSGEKIIAVAKTKKVAAPKKSTSKKSETKK